MQVSKNFASRVINLQERKMHAFFDKKFQNTGTKAGLQGIPHWQLDNEHKI